MIKANGKPAKALLVLSCAVRPLAEKDVWVAARDAGFGREGEMWFDALRTLRVNGLARRRGRRGGYEWEITEAGREWLSELEIKRPRAGIGDQK